MAHWLGIFFKNISYLYLSALVPAGVAGRFFDDIWNDITLNFLAQVKFNAPLNVSYLIQSSQNLF